MKIRRFYSKNMRTALRQVTEEFGEDAAILSSKKTPSGVEVIAALDYDEDLLPSSLSGLNQAIEERAEPDLSVDVVNHDMGMLTDINRNEGALNASQLSAEFDSQLSELNQVTDVANLKKAKVESKKTNIEWSTDPGLVAMKEELGLMRSMMSEQLRGMGWQRFAENDPIKAMLTRRFACMGVNHSIISDLIQRIKEGQDSECSWQNLLALLAKSISVNSQKILTDGGVFAFMGPTGAGKTTTIAKLAARFVIKHGVDSVALISTDNYRISAQQQLSNFSRILGVQMSSVSANRPIEYLLNQYKNKKLVLIDTAGMSKGDDAIAKQLDSLVNSGTDIKRFLMMPATNQLAVLRQSIELFRRYSPYSVIISKLDEAASLGEILSLLIENDLPVAFTTDGQRVPEDIRVARSHQLVSKAVWLTNKYGTNPDEWQLAQEQQYAQYA